MDNLLTFIEKIDLDELLKNDEATLKQTVILRTLSLLDWHIFNPKEVVPEYSLRGKKVDYSLQIDGKARVFIEVKRPDEDLSGHQEQLLNYAFASGVKLAILTNGISWWFYLPLQEGSWESRKFDSLDISRDDHSTLSQRITSYLSKENVASNKAFEAAQRRINEVNETKIISEAFPTAWNLIVKEDNQEFCELLNKKIEEICGYRAPKEKLANYIRTAKTIQNSLQTVITKTSTPTIGAPRRPSSGAGTVYWLIPFVDPGSLDRLIVESKIWAYGTNTPGRKSIKPGDWACFYLAKRGVVAHAQVASNPTYKKHEMVTDPEKYPWVFDLADVKAYPNTPVKLDEVLRASLEAFKGRDLKEIWGWFVQSSHPIHADDFRKLTKHNSLDK